MRKYKCLCSVNLCVLCFFWSLSLVLFYSIISSFGFFLIQEAYRGIISERDRAVQKKFSADFKENPTLSKRDCGGCFVLTGRLTSVQYGLPEAGRVVIHVWSNQGKEYGVKQIGFIESRTIG